MNLTTRGVAGNATAAALAMTSAIRMLEAAGVDQPAVWIAHGRSRFDATAAWDHGIALVRVEGMEADNAARALADAVDVRVVRSVTDLGRLGPSRGDGARLGARHELGLWPDERVSVVLKADHDVAAVAATLAKFEEQIATEPDTARRLVLADLVNHGPGLSEPVVAAILHPLILVELRRDPPTLDLLRLAADEIVEAG
jgi:hypothetical protein